jgi:hypothetical protein
VAALESKDSLLYAFACGLQQCKRINDQDPPMFDRIFPRQFDNIYRGHRLGLWLFIVVVLMELAMGTNSMINTRVVVVQADGIPLDSFGAGGADAVVAVFALAALFRVLLSLQCVVALVRYRAMIPFMYLLFLILHLGSKALLLVHPVARSGVATAQLGSAFVLGLIGMLAIGFILSIRPRNPQE